MQRSILFAVLILFVGIGAQTLDKKYQLWPKIIELPEVHEKRTYEIDDSKQAEESETEEMIPQTKKEKEEDELSFDTIWYNGTHTRTLVTVRGEAKFGQYTEEELRAHGIIETKTRRVRRMVFGQDNRFKVNRKYSQVYPFSTAVKLSTGCSGTLVSPRHVLTAAHCVYNPQNLARGQRKKDGKQSGKDLSVQFLNSKGIMKEVRAKKSMLPKNWLKKYFSRFDYAVIELVRKIDRPYLQIGVLDTFLDRTDQYLHFNAYDNSKPGQLLYRFCNISRESQEMLYSKCDSATGSDGAGVYIRLYDVDKDTWQRKIIGVYSANENNPIDEKYNTAVRITTLKYAQLCKWITGKYHGCKGK